ncbi:hypothetical protein QO010_003791 [Caulobacter ginsengisoli]|uniref:Uncharacterized protein n=1 Tax=Caulobacter ginsengisoli TaxID=400775 RepID=A0ABU0IVF6_9CAUL|nr:hypothetical protein [Caulobacter ginsengisoli]MDQ0465998.1 hypothetical protein [Caulobacter ginsengisoli]
MRLIGIGLAVALAIGVSAPNVAMAAKPKAPVAGAIDPAMHKKGQDDVPALLLKAGVSCTMADARMIGNEADKKTKAVIKAYYEVACQNAMGLVLVTDAATPDKIGVFPCLEANKPAADGKPSQLACILPGNADQMPYVQALAQKGGMACPVTKVRYIGANASNSFMEVACADGAGYILAASVPPDAAKPVKMNTCLAYEPGGNLFCELTDRASQLGVADKLLNGANGCTVTDRRYVLSATDGSTYFEVACANKKGYVIQETQAGAAGKIVDCVEATMIPGGCTLTDTVAAKTEKASFYSTLAVKAGFKCNVSQYGILPSSGATEVVELQCSDRQDGAIMISDRNGSKIYNCALSLAEGYRCTFTKIETAYPGLTALLKNFPAKSYNCNVDKVGATLRSETDRFVEVSCGAGEGTLVINFKAGSPTPTAILGCGEIKGCILPKTGV